MSADGRSIPATESKESAGEGLGHGQPCGDTLSGQGESVPLEASREPTHIKTEPAELHLEGASQEDGAAGARSWVPLSPGSEERSFFLPGGALPSPQFPVLSRGGRTRDRQMAAALLTAWAQMPVTFEDVALYLSREEWGRLGHTQNVYRDVLQKNGLAFGFPFIRPFWVPPVPGKGEGAEEKQLPASGAVEVAEAVPTVAMAALGDVKPFRTQARGGQPAAGGQGAGPARDAGSPAPGAARQPQAAAPDARTPESRGTPRAEQGARGFGWRSHPATHRRAQGGERPFACAACGKRFGRSSHLLQHQITHTGERPYACAACRKSFGHHSTLIQHQRIHSGEKPFACERCAKRFARRSDLVTHQGTHTGARPHKCAACGKGFSQSSALATHQRTHTGAKPYPCPQCGKRFSQRSNLVAHGRTHTGEKPYACADCGKRFSHSSHLTAHQRTHRGVRPYPCPLCGRSFSRRSNLHRHERIHASGPRALAVLMLGAAGPRAAPPPRACFRRRELAVPAPLRAVCPGGRGSERELEALGGRIRRPEAEAVGDPLRRASAGGCRAPVPAQSLDSTPGRRPRPRARPAAGDGAGAPPGQRPRLPHPYRATLEYVSRCQPSCHRASLWETERISPEP